MHRMVHSLPMIDAKFHFKNTFKELFYQVSPFLGTSHKIWGPVYHHLEHKLLINPIKSIVIRLELIEMHRMVYSLDMIDAKFMI